MNTYRLFNYKTKKYIDTIYYEPIRGSFIYHRVKVEVKDKKLRHNNVWDIWI